MASILWLQFRLSQDPTAPHNVYARTQAADRAAQLAKGGGGGDSLPRVTLAEVAKHHTPNDCWIVVENIVRPI